KYDSVAITVQVGNDSFHVKGTTVKESGWREVYGGDYSDDDDDQADDAADHERALLPDVQQGQSVTVQRCHIKSGRTML
ncbi:DNA topoisomerase, partial [Campylobacter sp. LH-2024]|uniref:DNA topoisomerase n=1 Tax=Campylobacter sp. LH-2024 TaxID=3239825 RepID=UPI003B8E004A